MNFCVKLICGAFCGLSLAVASAPLTIIAPVSVVDNYRQYLLGLPANGDGIYADTAAVEPFIGRRELAEMRILHMAAKRCDGDLSLNFKAQDNYQRIIGILRKGGADIAGTSVWRKPLDKDQQLSLTSAIIADGDYVVGLYVHVDRTDLLAITKVQQLAPYSVVSNRNWERDWQVLQTLNFAEMYHVSSSRFMARMVNAGRADFVLSQFPTAQGLSRESYSDALRFVPGIKVVLPGSRHYVWRKGALPDLFECVSQVLIDPEFKRVSDRLLEAAGVIYPPAANWTRLNPEPAS